MASKITQAISTKKSKPTTARSNSEPSGKRASRSEEKETPNKSRERSFSPATDDESSTASYDGSPNGDEDNTYGLPMHYSSQHIHMQVMVTGASTIEEQVANLMGAVQKLTKTVEEKDLQIVELYSRLESQDEEKKGQSRRELQE
ncbi:hypothetical protein ACLB2K_063567 [Fragaria x ananassa]